MNSQLEGRWAGSACALFVFVLSFGVYWLTLAPTVTLVDSGELILAAQSLGVPHPPGFPLYALLGHAASLLPLGSVAVRLHLASALFAALAAAMLSLLAIEAMLTSSDRGATAAHPTAPASNGSRTVPPSLSVIAAAVFAGLTFAYSRTLWAYATVAEVYTLNALLIVVIFWLMLAWRRETFALRDSHMEANYRKLYAAALFFGLALGVHHVTVALMLPALAALVISTVGVDFFRSKRAVNAALLTVAGSSVYLYLPFAASRSPLMNWGDPRTFERFWWHITGRQYQGYLQFSPSQLVEFAKLVSREYGPAWMPLALALAVAGLVFLSRNNRAIFVFLLLVVFFDVGFCLWYEIAEDKDAYYLPSFIALTIAAGFGGQLAVAQCHGKRSKILAALAIVLVPLLALVGNFAYNDRSRFFIAADYVDNVLRSVEPNGLLLTTDWQLYAPSLYVREIEHHRRDVIVIDVNQLRRSWYYDYLNQAYPELMSASKGAVDAFLEDLRAWEINPDSYAKSAALRDRINSRFYAMILSFVADRVETGDVYVTSEIALKRSGQDFELTKALATKYGLVPRGMAFRITNGARTKDSGEPRIELRGLSGDSTFKADDVVRQKIVPTYLKMAMSSGLYLASKGRHEDAIAKFEQALAIDATFEPAKRAMAKSYSALQTR